MADILPSPIPSVVPSLSGPSISFSATRKVLEAARSLGDDLEKKIRTSVQSGLADAAREGIRIETKVLNHVGKQLAIPEQLIEHITSLVQNSIAGNLAQAVATFEDFTTNKEATSSGVSQAIGGIKQSESFVFSPATSQQTTSRVGPSRATVPAVAVSGPPATLGRGAILTSQSGDCSDIFFRVGGPASGAVLNRVLDVPGLQRELNPNYYFFYTDACQLYVQQLSPPVPNPPCGTQYFIATSNGDLNKVIADIIIDEFQKRGVTLRLTSPDQACKVPEVYCKQHPFDPLCPPDCKLHPEDTRCISPPPPPPPPPPGVCCPEIKIPPCPPIPPLPTCIQIDLCDWKKLCDTLKDCLKQTSAEDCALDNETAYVYKDCDGTFDTAIDDWWGDAGKDVVAPKNYDDLILAAEDNVGNFSADDFSGPSPYA